MARETDVLTLQSAVSATGNGTVLQLGDVGIVAFQVSGTFVATVSFEATLDGTNWVAIPCRNAATLAVATTATAAGVYKGDCAGFVTARARVTWTSGTSITVKAVASGMAEGGQAPPSATAITIADGADATQGVTTGAAVITDAVGTVQQYLRGLVKLVAAKIGVTIADGDAATLGTTTGAAVITDAAGTVQQYLRGLVKLVAAKIGVTIADGDSATLGTTTGAAVVTDATGTVQQYLRGLVKLIAAKITVGIDQTTPGTTNKVDMTIGTVTPGLDDTNKQKVSLYGKATNAGDVPILCSVGGNVKVEMRGGDNAAANFRLPTTDAVNQDGYQQLSVVNLPYRYNGSTFDRQRNNQEAVVLASAARTATLQSADLVNYNGNSGLVLFLNVTALADTPTITPYLQIKDSISAAYKTVWTCAAGVTATGQYAYLFAPGGAAGSYTEAVNLLLGRTWRLGVTHTDADSITYSVSAVFLS